MTVVIGTALKRAKTSHAIVEHLQREILEGRLRPGDRIDVEGLSTRLGVSPTPVREALVLLQRDGLVSSQVHRSAYVEEFDAHTLRADFHVLGLLSGVAVARLAKQRDPAVLAELRALLDDLAAVEDGDEDGFAEAAMAIMRVEHREGATPRLQAELRGFSRFLLLAVELSDQRSHAEIVESHRQVIDAIAAGASRRASQARLEDARGAGEAVIGELVRRGVLAADD
jgi:DNA-binding GntR family transcriptional regulator